MQNARRMGSVAIMVAVMLVAVSGPAMAKDRGRGRWGGGDASVVQTSTSVDLGGLDNMAKTGVTQRLSSAPELQGAGIVVKLVDNILQLIGPLTNTILGFVQQILSSFGVNIQLPVIPPFGGGTTTTTMAPGGGGTGTGTSTGTGTGTGGGGLPGGGVLTGLPGSILSLVGDLLNSILGLVKGLLPV